MIKARYFFILLGLILMIYIFNAVRKRKLSVDLSILWSIGAVVILIFGCYPTLFDWIAKQVGIAYPPSLLFLMSVAFLLVLELNNCLTISDLKEKNKELIQQLAILEERVRKLEEKK